VRLWWIAALIGCRGVGSVRSGRVAPPAVFFTESGSSVCDRRHSLLPGKLDLFRGGEELWRLGGRIMPARGRGGVRSDFFFFFRGPLLALMGKVQLGGIPSLPHDFLTLTRNGKQKKKKRYHPLQACRHLGLASVVLGTITRGGWARSGYANRRVGPSWRRFCRRFHRGASVSAGSGFALMADGCRVSRAGYGVRGLRGRACAAQRRIEDWFGDASLCSC